MSALDAALRGASGVDAWESKAAARIGVSRIQERTGKSDSAKGA